MEAGGKKYDEGKLEWDMIPFEVLEDLARVYMMGRDKYDKDNWKEGIVVSRLFNAAMRHMLASWNGEDLDPESGLPHNIHAVWNLIATEWMKKNKSEMDDRPNTKKQNDIIEGLKLAEKVEKLCKDIACDKQTEHIFNEIETETCCKIKDLG